jgi:hypothetical protein
VRQRTPSRQPEADRDPVLPTPGVVPAAAQREVTRWRQDPRLWHAIQRTWHATRPVWRLLRGPRARWVPLAVFLLWTALSLASPAVQTADSGELQLVVRDLGIAHPPGYPLYTVAAHLFARVARIPYRLAPQAFPMPDRYAFGGWPWAINLFSTVLAMATLALVFATARRLTRSRLAGAVAALSLALTPTFAAQSVIANVRMPAAFFTALLLYLAVRRLATGGPLPGTRTADPDSGHPDASDDPSEAAAARHRPTRDRAVVAIALVAGLALGHHPSLVAVVLPVAVAVVARRPGVLREGPTVRGVLGALLVSCLPILYLPWRDVPTAPLAPGNLTTARGLLEHITGFAFRGDAFYVTRWADLVDRLAVLWNILEIQFGLCLLVGATLGVLWLARRQRASAAVLVATIVLISTLAITYRAPQTMEYLLPAYAAIAVLIGVGSRQLVTAVLRWLQTPRPDFWRTSESAASPVPGWAPVALTLVIGVWILAAGPRVVVAVTVARLPSQITHLLDVGCLPDRTTVLANWHHVTPLWFAQGERSPRRIDVAYVNPEGAEPYGDTWRRRLAALDGPVVITNRTRAMVDGAVPLWPVPSDAPTGGGLPVALFANRPGLCPTGAPPVAGDVAFGGRVRLVSAWRRDQDVTVAFEPLTPVTETLTIVAQAVDPAGTVWGQLDHSFPAARWNDPHGLADRLVIVPFRGFPGGPLDTLVGVYRQSPSGAERLTTASVTSPDGVRLGSQTVSGMGQRWTRLFSLETPPGAVPFADAMTLDRARVRRDGDSAVVDLDWRAGMLAHASDYTVSVQARGQGWSAQHDGTPALGAIPTLKWLPGMRIHDRHRVELPDDLAPDAPFTVTVGVYDAFSLEPLPVTNGERVRRGEGQAAVVFSAAPAP